MFPEYVEKIGKLIVKGLKTLRKTKIAYCRKVDKSLLHNGKLSHLFGDSDRKKHDERNRKFLGLLFILQMEF